MADAARHRDRELAGGVDLAEEHVGDGVAAFLPGIPRVQQALDTVEPGKHVDVAAGSQDHVPPPGAAAADADPVVDHMHDALQIVDAGRNQDGGKQNPFN